MIPSPFRHLAALAFAFCFAAPAAHAATEASPDSIVVEGAGLGGVNIKVASDLSTVLSADDPTLRVLATIGKGSVQNLADILGLKHMDAGLVQADVLAWARAHKDAFLAAHHLPAGALDQVAYIARLYDEDVHIVAQKGITRIEDLAGKPVNIDKLGSGNAMTAEVLFSTLGIAPKLDTTPQEKAVEAFKEGKFAALVRVVALPADIFRSLPADRGYHLLPIPPNDRLFDTYMPARLTHDDYPNLIPADAPVQTLAISAILATYRWQPGTERYAAMAHFTKDLFAHIGDLQKEGTAAEAWAQVNLAATVPGWPRFAPATELANPAPVAAAPSDVAASFQAFLARDPNVGPQTKQRMWEEFRRWQAGRQAPASPR